MQATATPPAAEPEAQEPKRASRLMVIGHDLSRVTASAWLWVWLWLTLIAFGWALSPAWNAWVVSSGSMGPALEVGDVVLTITPEHPLGPETVITYEHDGRIITHRIAETVFDEAGRPTYITKGDANEVEDTWTVHPHDVLGVGKVAVPHAGLPGWWATNGPAWLAIAFAVGTLLAAWWSAHPPELEGVDGYAPGRHRAPRKVEIWMPTLWPRAHILGLVIAAVMVTAAGGAATDAYFSAQTTNPSNTFTAIDRFRDGPGGYPGAVLASEPLSYFRLDEGSGTASDQLGIVTGTYTGSTDAGPPLIEDDNPSAALSGGWVDLGQANPITKTELSQRTVELWFRTPDVETRQVLYDEGGNAREIIMYVDAGMLYVVAHDNSWPNDMVVWVDVSPDTTYYAVAVIDATGDSLLLYLNGAFAESDTKTGGGTMGVRAGALSIGRANNQATYHDGKSRDPNPFGGLIDEVAIYDKALSADEIATHWAAGS